MTFTSLGSQSSDTPRTPTLRQWAKANPDIEIHACRVKTVFNPGDYGGHTFITEQDFKVVVEKGSSLDKFLRSQLSDALFEGTTLYIHVEDKAKGKWSLSSLEGEETDWDERTWGYVAGEVKRRKPDRSKNGANVRAEKKPQDQ